MYKKTNNILKLVILFSVIFSSTIYPGFFNYTFFVLKQENSNESRELETSANEITVISPETLRYLCRLKDYIIFKCLEMIHLEQGGNLK